MKNINILSLVQAKDNLDADSFENFLKFYEISIKEREIDDLKIFIKYLLEDGKVIKILDKYYVGYSIPQIGKEFDLLRFGQDCIVNIELKSTSTEEKILTQLQRNKYYLSFLKKEIHNFTFVSSEKKLYYLNASNNLEKVEIKKLLKLINKQNLIEIENIDKLFNPSDYLVSPFNSTNKFIKNKYFLTKQQEEIRKKILNVISDTTRVNFISITGSAGTGKTLLTYDIAKELIQKDKKVLIIHCGILNDGHEKLKSKYAWKVTSIKNYNQYTLSDYDLIIIDETQRIYPKQFDAIVDEIKKCSGNCIFSYDKVQTLSAKEAKNKIDEKINSITSITQYALSEKIRTNKEIANFIKRLFDISRNDILIENKNQIELNYFITEKEAKAYLRYIDKLDWQVIRYTPSQYNNDYHEKFVIPSETSHGVIGQEFDNVAIVIDDAFKYNKEGKLQYKGKSHYHPIRMLFQNLTRARKKLNIVIVANSEVLERCLTILK